MCPVRPHGLRYSPHSPDWPAANRPAPAGSSAPAASKSIDPPRTAPDPQLSAGNRQASADRLASPARSDRCRRRPPPPKADGSLLVQAAIALSAPTARILPNTFISSASCFVYCRLSITGTVSCELYRAWAAINSAMAPRTGRCRHPGCAQGEGSGPRYLPNKASPDRLHPVSRE